MEPDVRTRREILAATIRRLVAYAPRVTLFTRGSSVAHGLASAIADAEYAAHRSYAALVRRFSALGAQGAYLDEAMAELGAQRAPAVRARALVIIRAASTTVADIRTSGGDDYIEVEDASQFAAGADFRIRSADGLTTEIAGVASVSTGTGLVNGWDELVITGGLSNSYAPTTESVAIVRRVTIAAGTRLASSAGIQFDLLEAVSTSERNAVLDGESTALALADKGWVEAVVAGASGNVDPLSITGFATPIDGIVEVYNPAPAVGGADVEPDDDLRYRGVHAPASASQETTAWLEALAREANPHVSRALRGSATSAGTMAVKLLAAHGGAFSTAELTAIGAYIADRVRSYLAIEVSNVTLTSVAVSARIRLAPRASLDDVFKAASARLAAYLDWRTWPAGEAVDEAVLLTILRQTPGVQSLETATFSPASDVLVGAESFPTLTSLSLYDVATGQTRNPALAVGFPNA